MLNKNLFLNEEVLNNGEEQPIRLGYGIGLQEAGRIDKRVVALCADLTESTNTSLFRDEFKHRFVEIGIGEQSMASVASGMAAMGAIPFFASYAMFSPGRNWEQIRTTICYNNANAKIVGAHAGISVGPDGGTHQAIEDIAITRVIPNLTVIAPSDMEEARKATLAAAKHIGPVYIRLAREKTPVITTSKTNFTIGKAEVFFDTPAPTYLIVCTGSIVGYALKAAQILVQSGINVRVINAHTIKPLDTSIIAHSKDVKKVITIEEHQRIGGLGGAVSELLSTHHPIEVVRLGIDDVFGESGTPQELLHKHGLDTEGIVASITAL